MQKAVTNKTMCMCMCRMRCTQADLFTGCMAAMPCADR